MPINKVCIRTFRNCCKDYMSFDNLPLDYNPYSRSYSYSFQFQFGRLHIGLAASCLGRYSSIGIGFIGYGPRLKVMHI